jgi:hypothetical protein
LGTFAITIYGGITEELGIMLYINEQQAKKGGKKLSYLALYLYTYIACLFVQMVAKRKTQKEEQTEEISEPLYVFIHFFFLKKNR